MLRLSVNSKRIVASLLLGMFFFIQAEKVFHAHTGSITKAPQASTAIKSFSATCNICEFQATKDAQLPVFVTTGISYSVLIKEYAATTPTYCFYHTRPISGRGPPAQVL